MLEVLVGMIASGKSTYCRKRAEEDAIIVNDDAVCFAVHGNQHKYDPRLKGLYKTVENAIARAGLANGRDVIIDRPNLARRTRAKYIELAREYDLKAAAMIFPFEDPNVHAARRFNHDSRGIPLETWQRIAGIHLAEYEPVTVAEGFFWIEPKWPWPAATK